MMGKTHLVISTGLTLSALAMADETISLPVAAVAAASSLLPDIDEPNSLLVSRTIPKSLIRTFQAVLLGGAAAVYYFGQEYSPWNTIMAVLIAVISFLSSRTLRQIVMVLIGIGLIAFGAQYAPWSYIVGSVLVIVSFLPHRGLTHSVYGIAAWTILLYLATYEQGNAYWIAGGLSYLLHLLADSITNRGIRPLPPFEWRLKLRIMSTGTWKGALIEYLCMGATLAVVWFTFFHERSIFS